jgi:cell wall-associated NlpC family hydrolase
MKHVTVCFILMVALAGCGLKPAPVYRDEAWAVDARLPTVSRDDLLDELSLYHGVRYREGGTSLSGIDCSGLVQVVFGALGVRLPRTCRDQIDHGVEVSRGKIRAGDLVFFGEALSPSHVGIAVSRKEMVHASSSRGVVIENIDGFANYLRLAGIRRVVNLR